MFDDNNYKVWAIRMAVHLDALGLWEAMEDDFEVPALPVNPTIAQLKNHKEKKTKKSKTRACLYFLVSSIIFTIIINLQSVKEI